jgi:hypothetical protein
MSKTTNRINRHAFLLAAGAATAGTLTTPVMAQMAQVKQRGTVPRGRMDPAGRFGALLDRAEFDRAPRALHPNLVAKLPSQSELRGRLIPAIAANRFVLPNLPPVTMQGTPASMGYPGTCEAESFGYALGMQTVTRNVHLNTVLKANLISPAFLFAWLTNTSNPYPNCGGSYALQYLDLLVASGSASLAQVPYIPNCAALSPKSASNPNGVDVDVDNYPGAGRFQIGSYAALPNFLAQQATYLPLFKTYLRAGNAIAASGLVATAFSDPSQAMINGAFNPTSFLAKSGHGQLIVGFDDSLGTTGAFLIQNSMGTDWPYLGKDPLLQGRLWWTYEAFFSSHGFGAIANPKPLVVARNPLVVTIPLQAVGPGGPVATLVDAVRGNDSGPEYSVIIEHAFSAPVRIISVQLAGAGMEPGTGAHDAATRAGFVQIVSRRPFRPGTYDVHVVAQTIPARGETSKRVEYNGKIALR